MRLLPLPQLPPTITVPLLGGQSRKPATNLAIDFSHYVKVRDWLDAGTGVVLVELAGVEGSSPREAGAAMSVSGDSIAGTIGGGQLEWRAIAHARQMLAAQVEEDRLSIPLGPELGQCCGGRVELSFRRVDPDLLARLESDAASQQEAMPHVLIFGAGHTGVALTNALCALPYHVALYDSRSSIPVEITGPAEPVQIAIPESQIGEAPSGSAFIVMTHEHSLDFLMAAEALKRGDAAYVGMIGSKTKRAVFTNWLDDNGYERSLVDRLVCPIGGSDVQDKRPEVIAALTAAEIVRALYSYSAATDQASG